MATIRQLSDDLIGKIAAGEVVERPSSVVKELVENALDAGATEITVELEAGGLERIRVVDDGAGMSPEDAALAFTRHATSKIRDFDDLMEVRSLGFRGEALASIAAVAHVEMHTAESPESGVKTRADGGEAGAPEPAPRARGTTFEVASLFFNVPARRKFLKTPRTETRRVVEVVQGYALAHPETRFVLKTERGTLVDALAAGSGLDGLRQRVAQLFGEDLAAHLSEISRKLVNSGEIWGFVGDPTTTRGRRNFTFVNRRLLRDRAVLSTFYRAVRETWHGDQFPALFLFIDLPPSEVDVNVHPQKAEVRFRDGRLMSDLFSAIRRGLENSLGEVPAPLGPAEGAASIPLAWQGAGGRTAAYGTSGGSAPGEIREPGPTAGPGTEMPFPSALPGSLSGARLAEAVYAPLDRPSVPLSAGSSQTFRLLGQYKGTLILLEGPDGLYIIDQHVAHERILYERFRADLERETPKSQRLLEPVLLELSPAETLRLSEMAGGLEKAGFSLSELSGGSLAVTAVPAALKPREAENVLLEIAQNSGETGDEDVGERLLDALAASQACRAAVKMHEPLPADQIEALVAELFVAEQPYACPHGRPIVLKMHDRDLERRFGRR